MTTENRSNGDRVLSIPRVLDEPLTFALQPDQRLFIVGANGSGKSALLQHLAASGALEPMFRIPAFRQTSLNSSHVTMTGERRWRFEENRKYFETQMNSLWQEIEPSDSQAALLFDLVDQESRRDEVVARHVRNKNLDAADQFASNNPSLFSQMNRLLSVAGMLVSLEKAKGQRILARRDESGEKFGVEQMSDGERNAVLIAARVLTVEAGTTILIDEPERHLHRSIIEPFVSAMFVERTDCAFIVSTHEIALPAAHPDAGVLIVRSIEWNKNIPNSWTIDRLKPDTNLTEHERLPEALRCAILGSRKRLLFVEGDSNSIDSPIYTALFPNISVISVGSCAEVIKSIKGLRKASNLHHVEAFGLIDNDGRSAEEIEEFAKRSIFALDVWSAESLYYSSDAITAVAARRAEDLQQPVDDMSKTAVEKALRALNGEEVKKHVAARRCHNQVRRETLEQLPKLQEIMNNSHSHPNQTDVAEMYREELDRFENLIVDKDLSGLISRYPLRHSPAFGEIAKALHLSNRKDYERTVVSRIRADNELAQSLRNQIRPLSDALGYSCE